MPNARKLSTNKAAATSLANHDPSDFENSRFRVKKVGSMDAGGEHQDGLQPNQTTYVYDNKSISQLTGEALPKVDNYRNLGSVHNKQRPTVDELLKGRYNDKVNI